MSDVPRTACRAAQNSELKRQSRSETSVSGKPASRKTDASKFPGAVAEEAVLKVGTSQTRPVRKSI
jgi:hypothetical protein